MKRFAISLVMVLLVTGLLNAHPYRVAVAPAYRVRVRASVILPAPAFVAPAIVAPSAIVPQVIAPAVIPRVQAVPAQVPIQQALVPLVQPVQVLAQPFVVLRPRLFFRGYRAYGLGIW